MKKFLAMVLALCLTLGCAAAMAEKQTVKLVTWGGGEAYRLSTEEFNRRQDEIGTPFCVTYDFESEQDGAVTVRDRDTMEQERVKIEDLKAYFEKKFEW